MHTRTVVLCILLNLVCVCLAAQAREKISLNSGWSFVLNDNGNVSSLNEQTNWQKINLPHTWNAADIIDDTVGYHQGIGWYRKKIFIPAQYAGKHLELFFEGACNQATVFINGNKARDHSGGFTGFKVDLDNRIIPGQENEILVRVDNSKYLQDSIPPYSGDFNLMGGIYRDAWLIAANKSHFTSSFENEGVLFEISAVTNSKFRYTISASLNNHNERITGSVIYSLLYNNNIVRSSKKNISKDTDALVQINDSILNPRLWSPETPNLYRLVVRLQNEKGELLDEFSQNIGFKWVGISAKNEFLLNGKPYKLKGASRHQDFKNRGNALTDAMHIRDIELMKEMGCNFIRIAHYPQDPAIYDACDRLGLIAWSEIPVVDKVLDNPAFFANSETMMYEMILQNFNHPSIAIWGYHNEVRNLETVSIAHARRLNTIAKDLDPQRLTAIAFESNLDATYFKHPLLKEMLGIADINGYNVYQGWYRGDMKTIGSFLDSLYSYYPAKPVMLSEYGAGSSTGIHTDAPAIFDFSEEYQCLFQEPYLEEGSKRPWMTGWAIWNFIDFQRDGREDVQPNINNKGMVTTDRRPKDAYYYYKANWSRKPFVYIAGKNWKDRYAFVNTTGASQTVEKDIVVYSNQEKVKLYCNGKPAVSKSSTNGKFVFTALLKAGMNQLVCQAGDTRLTDVLDFNFHFISLTEFSKNFPGDQLCFNTGQSRSFYHDAETNENWLPDKEYKKGGWGYTGGTVYNDWPYNKWWNGTREGIHKPVALTNNEPVFQTFVEGLTAWKADVPDGHYRISVLLCEPFTPEQRKQEERIMDILLNGESWKQALNIGKEFGVLTAVTLEKEIKTNNAEGITINFSALSGKTILNGIRIQKL